MQKYFQAPKRVWLFHCWDKKVEINLFWVERRKWKKVLRIQMESLSLCLSLSLLSLSLAHTHSLFGSLSLFMCVHSHTHTLMHSHTHYSLHPFYVSANDESGVWLFRTSNADSAEKKVSDDPMRKKNKIFGWILFFEQFMSGQIKLRLKDFYPNPCFTNLLDRGQCHLKRQLWPLWGHWDSLFTLWVYK